MNADIFPNVEWFQQASVVANESDAFRSLGTIDCRMGFRSGDNVVALTFESFSCTEVSAWEVDRLRDLDFWIEMGPDRWKEFLAKMCESKEVIDGHTLNSLDLSSEAGIIRYQDEIGGMKFFRYINSIEKFLELSLLSNSKNKVNPSGK